MTQSAIIYTHTDEAPALATFSLLPVIRSILRPGSIDVTLVDISLASRILAAFSDDEVDGLAQLGELVKTPAANIMKLPNISASVPQLQAAITELRAQGYDLPDYPNEDSAITAKYDAIKGSAVNPVLREGNSDRRAPGAVKRYAQKNPHSMGKWAEDSQTSVQSMTDGDFRSNEKSVQFSEAESVTVVFYSDSGKIDTLKTVPVEAGDVIDATFMSAEKLRIFLEGQRKHALTEGVLLSLHLKATMMKVADPIIFGHAVKVFFKDVFEKHADAMAEADVNPNDGLGSVIAKIEGLSKDKSEPVLAAIGAAIDVGPELAMVNSDQGITNLHVPSDVIVDASIPAMIRAGGLMWNRKGSLQETRALIPDSSYSGVFKACIEDCKKHGALNPATIGTCPNVGLMAKKAQEYGSHDKTFEIPEAGKVKVIGSNGKVLLEHRVAQGDIWRMCQTKLVAIENWVKLAVDRARASSTPVVFWLDSDRSHDAILIGLVEGFLENHPKDNLDIRIMDPVEATKHTLKRMRKGKDTISATGNVLRDYLTDLFPILELGTSAKMLSIVPLLEGGGLFETGAGGSAPKHVQQLCEENHLRWDSLGEFLALGASLEHIANTTDDIGARVYAETLDRAVGTLLEEDKSPKRGVRELDNRGSHFYLTLYWTQELAAQDDDTVLQAKFTPIAKALAENEDEIIRELTAVQGMGVDIGGYYRPDADLVKRIMRPSETFNGIIDSMAA